MTAMTDEARAYVVCKCVCCGATRNVPDTERVEDAPICHICMGPMVARKAVVKQKRKHHAD